MMIRGSLARTIYSRYLEDNMDSDKHHKNWYYVNTAVFPPDLATKFLLCHQDEQTSAFLENSTQKSDWLFTQIYHSFAKSVLSWFMEVTSVNGLLHRGSMFVFSEQQFLNLFNRDSDNLQDNMLDIGAGDGEITKVMAKFFRTTYATETSKPMRWRLRQNGFQLLEVSDWYTQGLKFNLISCLNVLDRCQYPKTLLQQIKTSMAPDGVIVLALVLPFSPFVEFSVSGTKSKDHRPSETLNIKGATFEQQVQSVITNVFTPLGLTVVRFTKLPYLCEGDLAHSYYSMADAVFVLKSEDPGDS